MILSLYQVDAFAERLFKGNPAAVVPLSQWLPDEVMQSIAAENNLSETAFFVPVKGGFHIRWFTPGVEVALCGHATLASAHILFEELGYNDDEIRFESKSGPLFISKVNDVIYLNFPSDRTEKVVPDEKLINAIGKSPVEIYKGKTDYLLVYESEEDILQIKPDFYQLRNIDVRGVIVTAQGNEVDFVSRFFAPGAGDDEDPVTGSAHTTLIPYWSKQLKKNELTAIQKSKRSGNVFCKHLNDRVLIGGKAVTYLKGSIEI